LEIETKGIQAEETFIQILEEEFENKIWEDEWILEKPKKRNSFIRASIFMTKYCVTSSLIFWVLLIATNYSAYFNIAKSYVFKEKIAAESKGIISSVEASNFKEIIIQKEKEEREKETNTNEDVKINHVSDYAIENLISLANKEDIEFNIQITPYENRIVIPKIGKNIPLLDIKNQKIEWAEELNNIFMEELENGVIRYPGSAKPGEEGNAFIFWHSSNFPWIDWEYNDVFALLDKVVYDDEIITYYGQKKRKFKVKEKKVIRPGDVSVLKRNKNKSEITLMTCWPIGTTLNRLIVVAELVEDENAS
jgi:LPXTG-site transpeptidase (sortase) family protein